MRWGWARSSSHRIRGRSPRWGSQRRPSGRDREPARRGAARGTVAALRGRDPHRTAAAGTARVDRARRAGHRVGVVARRGRRGCVDSGSRDPGGPRRDRARRARLVRHGARLGCGGVGARMTLAAVGLVVREPAFASVAEEMGLVLIHSAVSPNIRERRDCSAALVDAAGGMIAQAAHIPVHLGALHESVAVVRALAPAPGELFILNDPYTGGSHLPDITLVGAVDVDGAVGGYGVVRAHHSDVGGMQAGSMPAGARELFAEGVIVPPLRLTPDVERFLLANVRTPETRRADLAAQRAAVERGADGLRRLATRHGWTALREAARDLQAYAERRAREALARLEAT